MAEHIKLATSDGGGQYTPRPPGGGDGMDTDNRLTKLETKLDTLLPLLATKGDVAESTAKLVMWIAGAVIGAVAIIVSVMAFMLNRAVPVQSAQPNAPIVIYPQSAPLPVIPPAPQSPPVTKPGR